MLDDDDNGDGSASIVGEWTYEFSDSKGHGISIFTFNQNGTGKWRELSNESHGYYEEYEDPFIYTLEGSVLSITYGTYTDLDEETEIFDVIRLTSSQLTIKEWGHSETLTLQRMTEDMRRRIYSLQNN